MQSILSGTAYRGARHCSAGLGGNHIPSFRRPVLPGERAIAAIHNP